MNPEEVLIESTGVIGHRIKKVQHISHSFFRASAPIKLDYSLFFLQKELLQALPTLVSSMSDSVEE